MTRRSILRGLYKLCECGCRTLMPFIDKNARCNKYIKGHHWYLPKYKGMNNHHWKTGRILHYKGYWSLYLPHNYKANKKGYVIEHVYFYEQYHKCCVLPWGVVHHITPVKDGGSNMPWNLRGMMKQDHDKLPKSRIRKTHLSDSPYE